MPCARGPLRTRSFPGVVGGKTPRDGASDRRRHQALSVSSVTTEARIRARSKTRGSCGVFGTSGGGGFDGSRCSPTTWTCTRYWSKSEKAPTDECSKGEENMLARCVASRVDQQVCWLEDSAAR